MGICDMKEAQQEIIATPASFPCNQYMVEVLPLQDQLS